MRDPRLAELECLMTLERNGPLAFNVPKGSKLEMFGLTSDPLRQMLAELIEQGFVNGNASAMDKDWVTDTTHNIASEMRNDDLNKLRLGHEITLKIGHKGRARLFNLRDELRDETRDEFRILYTRHAWDQALAVQLLFATPESPLAVLFADIDHFKKVNDTYGHDIGDEVLKRVFAIVRDATGDRAYRYGGEEIGALLPGTKLESAAKVAEVIRQKVSAEEIKIPRGEHQGKVHRSTLSIGLAVFHAPASPAEAFHTVDELLLKAKREGRDRVEVPPSGR